MTAEVQTTTVTVRCAVYRTDGDASVNLCLSQPARTKTTKKTEHNLFVRSGKSEAEVTNNRRLHSTCRTTEDNYWQTQSKARPLCDSRAICDKCSIYTILRTTSLVGQLDHTSSICKMLKTIVQMFIWFALKICIYINVSASEGHPADPWP